MALKVKIPKPLMPMQISHPKSKTSALKILVKKQAPVIFVRQMMITSMKSLTIISVIESMGRQLLVIVVILLPKILAWCSRTIAVDALAEADRRIAVLLAPAGQALAQTRAGQIMAGAGAVDDAVAEKLALEDLPSGADHAITSIQSSFYG